MKLSLYNTLTKTVEPFLPLKEGEVRMYSCGPTVYDYAHIGNLKAFLFPDILQRTLRIVCGYRVKWVMNITDIDDKTIRDSAIGSEKWNASFGLQTQDPKVNLKLLTSFYEQEFRNDLAQIGIKESDFSIMPRATDFIHEMQELIRNIHQQGFAYESEGSIYFDVAKWREKEEYGRLFAIDQEHFKSGVRIDADEYSREHVSDFVLWKAQKEGEPYWEFQLGNYQLPGRPGWHIECSAMGHAILGLPFDIHTGGIDLRFPHHEDEIAQSKAGYGSETAQFWCHNEFLEVEGKKMSKSFGNFYTLRDLLEKGMDPLDIRFSMVNAQYGSVFNFTEFGIESASKARKRVQEYVYACFEGNAGHDNHAEEIHALRNEFFSALCDDLHLPKAIESIFAFMKRFPAEVLSHRDKPSFLELMYDINEIVGVWSISPRPEAEEIPEKVKDLAEQRWNAKASKNFTHADDLRKEVLALGYVIKDSKDSYSILKEE
ncbi:MAG: cysteine--tRNA ligase [Bacteroidetes bacterium]|nr:cysteine--tRNA ligase [bacterium]NBP63513.1 cysteine--tRNA ligase [Bacteroidota bacterium]